MAKKKLTPEQQKKALEVGERIRALREQKGYSQKGFGPMIGLSAGAAAQWETGRIIPKLANLKKIADKLGTTTEYLWAGDDEEEQRKAHTNQELRGLKALRRIAPEKLEAALMVLEAMDPSKSK